MAKKEKKEIEEIKDYRYSIFLKCLREMLESKDRMAKM